jgi:hypothetical protein
MRCVALVFFCTLSIPASGKSFTGMRRMCRALEKDQAQLCILADDCNQPDYKRLIEALCTEKNVDLVRPMWKEPGGANGACHFCISEVKSIVRYIDRCMLDLNRWIDICTYVCKKATSLHKRCMKVAYAQQTQYLCTRSSTEWLCLFLCRKVSY